jgi:hypothetical protein
MFSRLVRWHGSLTVALLATLSSPAAVVINEIHYRPLNKLDRVEFVELFNTGTNGISLAGWRLDGAVDYVIPNGTQLAGGGFLVIAQDPAALATRFGVSAYGPWTGYLSNEGEEVRLLNAAGNVEDKVDYQLGFPWPTVGDAPGYSIELINPELDNDLGGSWRASVNGSAVQTSTTLIPSRSTWRYFKGTSEASSPSTAWREPSFQDGSWLQGPMPIGYDPAISMGVYLDDMRFNYTTVFFRRSFVVENVSAVRSLTLSAMYDDGFKVWINGQAVRDGEFGMRAGEVAYTGTATTALESAAYKDFTLDSPASYLVSGTNTIAIQAANSSLGSSSDFYLDVELKAVLGPASQGPTPGAINSVYATTAPPLIRQVEHQPEQPNAGQPVTITAKITDLQGIASVSLQYQVVQPGSYVALTDAAYTNAWSTLAMNDSGTDGDAVANDDVFTVVIPGSSQIHRGLVRYRLTAVDGAGATVRVPYADDPEPNFAYFCYDGVPQWTAAVQPGVTPVLTFPPSVMEHLPAVHLIAKQTDVENGTWFSRYGGDAYPWIGTLVYDGKVYDHIHFRARGGVWRYAMVKNMWKFDLNNGHYFQPRDDYGRKLATRWSKLNLGASIQQGDYLHRGEQGMFESVGFSLFNLAGVEAPKTAFAQFRVVDSANEAESGNQYEGDFWGVYLMIEQEDGRFLDEHELPDGNLYKMEGYTGELNNLGKLGPEDKSDLNAFLSTYRDTTLSASELWWRSNLDLQRYASYQSIVQGIHHYDISDGKNYFYYRNPDTGLWSVHSWDLDLTWANNMYRTDGGGVDELFRPVLGGNGHSAKPAMTIDFKNRMREIVDLLFNTDQAWQLIDEHAVLLRGPSGSLSILDADRCRWDYDPRMSSSAYSSSLSKAGQGRFYRWENESGVSKDFNGCITLMKNYVAARVAVLNTMSGDSSIPAQPAISYTGPTNYPLDQIRFTHQAPVGTGPLKVKWRVGEVTDSNAPAYDPSGPRAYEIAAVWESSEISYTTPAEIAVPSQYLNNGHAYRARLRVGDSTGRWSHWSAPVQFICGTPSTTSLLTNYVRITELMIDPAGGSDYEFVELRNTHDSLSIDLNGARFTSGISYVFPPGTVIPAGGYLVVHKQADPALFRAYYGLSQDVLLAGPYSGSLANNGEEVTLRTGSAGDDIFTFEYGDGRGWPVAARAGHSMVPLTMTGQSDGALDYPGNWRASTYIKGSPGAADPEPPAAALVLNEIVAHTDYTDPTRPEYDSNDWIELFNASTQPVSLSNYFLSDDPAELRKYAFADLILGGGGFLTVDEVSGFHNPITSGFGLDKAGEQVLLSYLPGNSEDRVVDAVKFKGQENGVSLSRYPDASPWWFQSAISSNAPNLAGLGGVVINEIMYRPPTSGADDNTYDEYVELFNPGSGAITLSDSNGAWHLAGGVEFTFAAQTTIPAGGTLLLVHFDPSLATNLSAFQAAYGITNNSLTILGPYTGKLGNRSDRVAVERPQAADVAGDPVSWIVVDEVIYGNQAPFPREPNGGGFALQRVASSRHGLEPANWISASPTPGIATASDPDSDGDGMPDAWEELYQLSPKDPSDATSDPDNDGMTNLAEFWSGTDPRDRNSRLEVIASRLGQGSVRLSFTARVGRSYTIQFRGDAASGSWESLADVEAWPEQRDVVIEDNNAQFETRFYRLVTPAVPR